MLIGLTALSAWAQAPTFPQAEISNGIVKALIYLPDAQRGYYRGVRFDWSGVVASLTYKGHEFFGQWFPKYDPLLHDAIMGPVEEFRSEDGGLGYSEAKPPKGMFVKIGVGVLRKRDDQPYNFARGYALVNPGERVVRAEKDRVEFEQELDNGEGYAYRYTKTLLLPHGKPQLILEHTLKNVGRRVIDTEVYNHDFFMLDHLPIGPDIDLKFAFQPKSKDGLKGPIRIEGDDVRYGKAVSAGESASGYLVGFDDSADDDDVRVENVKAGIGVREMGDKPISKLFLWSIPTTVCPEIYIKIHVEPGKTFKWRTTYAFYLLN